MITKPVTNHLFSFSSFFHHIVDSVFESVKHQAQRIAERFNK